MTPEDIRRALIEAYELGREHGQAKEKREQAIDNDITLWCKTRERLLRELEEKATL